MWTPPRWAISLDLTYRFCINPDISGTIQAFMQDTFADHDNAADWDILLPNNTPLAEYYHGEVPNFVDIFSSNTQILEVAPQAGEGFSLNVDANLFKEDGKEWATQEESNALQATRGWLHTIFPFWSSSAHIRLGQTAQAQFEPQYAAFFSCRLTPTLAPYFPQLSLTLCFCSPKSQHGRR